MRLTRPLLLGVELARALLFASVPADVAKLAERDEAVRDCAAWTRAILTAGRSVGRREQLEYRWRLLTSRRQKAIFWASYVLMPTPSDLKAVPIPASLFPAYYLLRPFRLLWVWRSGRAVDLS